MGANDEEGREDKDKSRSKGRREGVSVMQNTLALSTLQGDLRTQKKYSKKATVKCRKEDVG